MLRCSGHGGGVPMRGSEERAKERWRPPGRLWKRRGAWLGRGSSSARQQEGEEVVRDAWEPAHGEVMAGKAGKASAAALSVASAARTEQGGGRWS